MNKKFTSKGKSLHNILLIVVCVFSFLVTIDKAYSQAPQAIPYQGVARNASGDIRALQNISLRFSIHDGTSTGTIVFRETHNVTTTNLGLFNVNIGSGTRITGTLAGIKWGTGAKFIQVEMDAAGGSAFVDMGTTQLNSVPYALYAENANVPGVAGPAGPQGATGATGAAGTNGTNGVKGDTGTQGPIGASGPAGTNGTNGLKGDTGLQGPIGVTGTAGTNGSNGINGVKGDQGIKGDKGDTGVAGAQGAKGDTGLQGPIGVTGTAGTNGSNGIDGVKGDQGIKGDKGDTGVAGVQGSKGDTGSQGLIGVTGDKGAIGETGAQGLKGDKGEQGIQGVIGETGAQGPAGKDVTLPVGTNGQVLTSVGGTHVWQNLPSQDGILGDIVALKTGLTSKADKSITINGQSLSNDVSITPETLGLKPIATSGSYNDLTDKPIIPAAQVNADWQANSGIAQILNKPNIAAIQAAADAAKNCKYCFNNCEYCFSQCCYC
jgi:hypothetical protein